MQLLHHIRKETKRIKPNLVYVTPNACGRAFYKDWVVVMMLKAMKQKVIIHYHNKGVATRQDRFLDDFLYKSFFKEIKIILLADVLYEDIKKYVSQENIFICPNGIPESTGYNRNHITNEVPHILFLSKPILNSYQLPPYDFLELYL